MTDKNRKLWLDTRGVPVITTTKNGESNANRWGWTEAEAVALAARQPSGDDREAAFESGMEMVDWGMVRDGVGDPQDAAGIAVRAALEARAAVPDAATEQARADSEWRDGTIISQLAKTEAERDAARAECRTLRGERNTFENDLAKEIDRADAALAAIERVRAALSAWEMVQARNREYLESGNSGMIVPIDCTGGLRAALDGAPEPDLESQLARAARELNSFGWTCHGGTHEPGDYDSCEDCQTVCFEIARAAFHAMSGTPHLSADQVWTIAKAAHDYATDTDNVPAFVMPLVDGLRAAGVAFDEQPFIDSGYLLPVEGEKP